MYPLRAVGDAARLGHRDEELKVDQIEMHGHGASPPHKIVIACNKREVFVQGSGATKQSILTHQERMDCFATLAMTVCLRHRRRLSP